MLTDQTGEVELMIPAGALRQDSEIGVTILASAEAIRDRLPQLVAAEGTFIDISGVFGDETDIPVTLRVPNQFNLPIGTKLRFGKIDHNTTAWSDMRDAFGGEDPLDPDAGIGAVMSDGQGGTFIEVTFTHFCTVCTGYCLSPPPPPAPPPPSPLPPPCTSACCGSGGGSGGSTTNVSGSSVISTHEGHLWEVLQIPTFRERGGEWGIQLGYASYSAAPSKTLSTTIDYQSTRPIERTVFKFSIEGQTAEAFYGRTQNNEKPQGSFFWDGRNGLGDLMPTGSYSYSIDVTSLNANSPVAINNVFGGSPTQVFGGITYPGLVPLRAETTTGRVILVNLVDSPYGAGWSLIGEVRLYFDPDGCIVVVEANALADLYVPDALDPDLFVSPAGDFSSLRRLADGTYERSFNDGSADSFNPSGRLVRRVDRYGLITQLLYSQGLLSRMISPTGNYFDFFYSNGRLSSIVDSAGRQTLFGVDASDDLVSMTDAVGSTRIFSYDSEHRMIGQLGSRGERVEYVYDNGRVVGADNFDVGGGTLLRSRHYEPSVLQGEIGASLAQGLGQVIESPIPPVLDRVDRYIDGRGAITEWETNARGLVTQVTDGMGRVKSIDYDDDFLVTSTVRPDNSSTTFAYNVSGDLTGATELFNGATVSVEYNGPFGLQTAFIDQLGNPTTASYFINGSVQQIVDAQLNTTTFFYEDSRFPDQPTRFMDAAGLSTHIEYDTHGNTAAIVNPLLRRTEFAYDTAGNAFTSTDARSFTTTFSYDPFNRPITAIDAESRLISLSYGENGCGCSTSNLTQVTLADNSTVTYEFDGLDRMVARTDPGGRVSLAEYDPEGALTLYTRRNGEVIRQVNDPLGRLVQTVNDADGTVIESFRYDALGNIIEGQNQFTTVSFVYDSLSRLISETQEIRLPTAPDAQPGDPAPLPILSSLNYGYDLADQLISRVDQFGTEIFRYDARGIMDEVEYSDNNVPSLLWTFTHDELGRRTAIDFPNGLNQSFAYDNASQLQLIELTNSAMEILDRHEYTRFSPTAQLEEYTRLRPDGGITSFTYDYSPTGRLTSATRNEIPPGAIATNQSAVFTPDSRIANVDGAAVVHDALGRIIQMANPDGSDRIFEYEVSGDLARIRDELASTTLMEAEYFHDVFGRRLARRVNGVVVVDSFHQRQPVARSLGDGTLLTRTVTGRGFDELLGQIDSSGVLSSIHRDRLGTVVAVSSPDQSIAEWRSFAPFGAPLATSLTMNDSRFGFGGLPLDPETQLVDARARALNTDWGRFMSEDPIGLRGGSNEFAFVRGDPVNRRDPDGTFSFFAQVVVAFVVLETLDLLVLTIISSADEGEDGGGSIDPDLAMMIPVLSPEEELEKRGRELDRLPHPTDLGVCKSNKKRRRKPVWPNKPATLCNKCRG